MPNKLSAQRTLRGQIDGQVTTQTMLGREYLVVPVIAMVEGVRFGANSDGNGELGLAEEFQKTPDGWNSKPVVLNHPQVNGAFVSANSPTVLEEYFMGLIMHTEPIDKKLRMEAWLDSEAKENSAEITTMFERIESGEVVEVSVGMFLDIEETSGVYNNESYSAVWRNIVPDHLALLEAGTIGACSVEDGCGTHRNQSVGDKNMPKKISVDKQPKTLEGCPCGGDSKENCKCVDQPVVLARTLKGFKVNKDNADHVTINHREAEAIQMLVQNLGIQGAPDDMLSNDIRSNLVTALDAEFEWPFVVGYTNTQVVYEVYSYDLGRWAIYQRPFDMDNNGKVTFTADAEEVRLLTRVVPIGEGDLNVNQGDKENEMPKAIQEGQTAEVETTDAPTETIETTVAGADAADTPVVTETAEVVEPVAQAAPVTAQSYIEDAPEEIRDMLNSALSTHNSAKTSIVKALQATGRCKFSDDTLNAMSLQELQNMEQLANVPSYEGRTAPTAQANADDSTVPAAPKVSERLKALQA